jgi:transketolase
MTKNLTEKYPNLDEICINTIRTLAMDAIQKANSGHPGAPMGLAPAAYVLWTKILKHNPKNPGWHDRDRFVLSGGHASMLLYSLLYLTGYDINLDDIKNFRQWGSKTPGHPEFGCTPGVETTTGPLGQGFANAVGMAMAERHLAEVFNRPDFPIVDHYTYAMCGDGDLMEGLTSEAASLAGHLGLGRLLCIYDNNNISIEGNTNLAFTEDVALRFKAYNWHVLKVEDGNDLDVILSAIHEAREEHEKPSLIMLKTHIAFGSPHKQDSASAHGAPLGEEEIRLTKKNLHWPYDTPFYIPELVIGSFKKCIIKGEEAESLWKQTLNAYKKKYPDLAMHFMNAMDGILPESWDKNMPEFSAKDPIATRAASGKVLNCISTRIPTLLGGSADLAPSNNTRITSAKSFQKNQYAGRNIHFGVREHAMGGVTSGMAIHKGLKPYCGTFLVFSDYMRPSIRLAAVMKLPVIYIFTHDSIAVGEDGPTHQPIEQLTCLRAIPNLIVIRPADAIETLEGWKIAVKTKDSPVALALSRQKLPVLDKKRHEISEGMKHGAYVLEDSDGKPDAILIATGSEVHLALAAKEILSKNGASVRVVSMPSWELFEKTPLEYKDKILLPDVKIRIAIEAGIPLGWERYVGAHGKIFGISRFGASAPGDRVMGEFGFTPENISKKTLALLN